MIDTIWIVLFIITSLLAGGCCLNKIIKNLQESSMAKNYTDKQTKRMVEMYQSSPTRETVEVLANEMGKTVKSVIGKLSREGVYVKKEYVTKRGEKPVTKQQMVEQIAQFLEGDAERLETLVKASKQDLLYLKVLVEDIRWEIDSIHENGGTGIVS